MNRGLISGFVLSTLFLMNSLIAQEEDSDFSMEDWYVKKPLLILKSTTDYSEALAFARKASAGLGLELNLRGLLPHERWGLTFSEQDCLESEFNYPCYIARGRHDDGAYISIEYSSAYTGFSKGYYIVIAAGGEEAVSGAKESAKKLYPDAYAKTTKVYYGCMH